MAEKKIHARTITQMTRWIQMEKKASNYLLKGDQKSQVPDESKESAKIILAESYLTKPGLLSELYLAHLSYLTATEDEDRKKIEWWIDKYLLYSKTIEEHKGKIIKEQPIEPLIRSEALKVMAKRHSREEQRYNDIYNVKMLLEDSGKDILYCPAWKSWLLWDSHKWQKDEAGEIHELATDAVNGMYEKALKLNTEEEQLILMEHASRNKSIRKIEAIVRGAAWKYKIRIRPEELDKDLYLFNCQNGTIDLKSGRLKEPLRDHRITKMSPVPYDPEAKCPRWLIFIEEIFHKNKKVITFIQKTIGMSLTGDVSAQAMFILHGTGANGKSTFINTLMKIFGDYAASTPTETFMQKKGEAANNDIARLRGTRFVSAMEAERGMKLAEAVIKRVTGNDALSARFLYGEFFEFIPTFKIFMATNHKPKIGGMDNAIWRRIHLIPFNAVFSPEQRDPHLTEKLEEELPGILSWMVEGCINWLKTGLAPPDEVKYATEEYRHDMSAVESFLEECCNRDESNLMIKSSHLYEAYRTWATTNNEHILSHRGFSMRIAETGIDKVRMSNGFHWIGMGLKMK